MAGIVTPTRQRYYESSYTEIVLETDPIAHWTLGERFGATAYDTTQNRFNGAITGATLGQPGIGDGLTSMYFDGATDIIDVFSPGLAAAWNGNEYSWMIWVKVEDVPTWQADYTRFLQAFAGGDFAQLQIAAADGFVLSTRKVTVAVSKTADASSTLDWIFLVATISRTANEHWLYFDAVQQGAAAAVTNAWANPVTTFTIGAQAGPSNVMKGWLAHPALWTRALTPAEVQRLYRARWTR